VPVYSPLQPPNTPLEIYRATVEDLEPITWEGHIVEVWVVAYRSESGLSSTQIARPRGRLWVGRDGVVLKQEAMILDRPLLFVRLSEEKAAALLEKAASL